jgi:hypothetical protein
MKLQTDPEMQFPLFSETGRTTHHHEDAASISPANIKLAPLIFRLSLIRVTSELVKSTIIVKRMNRLIM